MSRSITIQGTEIEFPESGESPDWGEAVVEFAEAVEDALASVAGTFDVPPQTLNIDAQNPTSTNVDIPNLSFSTASVRAAFITVAVYRDTSTTTVSEAFDIITVYNPENGSGLKWSLSVSSVGDDSLTTFNITDVGQVQFTTTALGGTGHTGLITYTGKAVLNS